MSLPFLGADQVGDAYYFSPVNVSCFGISDQTRGADKDTLDAFVYMEHEGHKGGNNVVSLIHKFLTMKGLLNKDDPIGELNFTFDNCAGQNKNYHVLTYFAWLVEEGYMLKTACTFLVRGHTKNCCDRMFNRLKTQYRLENIYTVEQLMAALNKAENVDAHRVAEADFKDWGDELLKLYRKPAGVTKKPHCFSYKVEDIGKLSYSFCHGDDVEELNLKKRLTAAARQKLLDEFKVQVADPPGMSLMKKIEMYDKWRKFVPVEHRVDPWFLVAPTAAEKATALKEKGIRLTNRRNAATRSAAPPAAAAAAAPPAAAATTTTTT